jgi:LuxR family transcriptional activator of conjugal transfer of Ti plasmids
VAKSQLVGEAVAKHAFEVVTQAETLASIEALNACFRDTLLQLGFQVFGCLAVIEGGKQPQVETLFGEGFGAWGTHYKRMQFAQDDPIIKEAKHSSDPFYWSDVVRRPLSMRALRVIDAAKQFQLYDGFVAPMRSPDGATSFILFAGDSVDTDNAYARAGARLLADYYGRVGHRIHRASSRKRCNAFISERQRECLTWARAGKSSKDIGEILGISATVVDEHIGKVCERLEVRTRVQAILEAGRRGVDLGTPGS